MLRIASVLGASLVVLATTPSFASTSGAHFFNDTGASVDPDTGALVVHIDEGGLGNENIDYDIAWTGNATYQCFNNGGNHPKAGNKETVSGGGDTQVSLQAKNGRVQADVPVPGTPPGPGTFSCPSGQTLFLVRVSYSVTITDTTNDVSTSASASASNLFIEIP